MKAKRVSGATFHIGVRVIGEVLTGINAEQRKVDLFLEEYGITVVPRGTRPNGDLFPSVIVPFSNIVFLELAPEEQPLRKVS